MLLVTIFVELRVVARRSRMRAGSPQAVCRLPCCAVAFRRTAWSAHGMASVNQTQPHRVNQMVKTHSKPLAAWRGRSMGTACYVWIGLEASWRLSFVSLLSDSIWTMKIQVNTTQLQLRLLQHYKSMKRTSEDKSSLGYDTVLIRNKLPKFHSSIYLLNLTFKPSILG
jgi:hypothetical protein